jgi:hypothetical protein
MPAQQSPTRRWRLHRRGEVSTGKSEVVRRSSFFFFYYYQLRFFGDVSKRAGKPVITPTHGACPKSYALVEIGVPGPEGKTGLAGKTGPEEKAGPEGRTGLGGAEEAGVLVELHGTTTLAVPRGDAEQHEMVYAGIPGSSFIPTERQAATIRRQSRVRKPRLSLGCGAAVGISVLRNGERVGELQLSGAYDPEFEGGIGQGSG